MVQLGLHTAEGGAALPGFVCAASRRLTAGAVTVANRPRRFNNALRCLLRSRALGARVLESPGNSAISILLPEKRARARLAPNSWFSRPLNLYALNFYD